jgi:NAD(P)-dependent dehydrogenase (short-subunit alcohol dehydrogenase family)
MQNLKGKNIIITGGGRGIGAEASRLLASEGANVILTCRTKEEGLLVEKGIIDTGGSAKYIYQDVTSENDWDNVIKSTILEFGRVDSVVNNAGSFLWQSMEGGSLKEFKNIIDQNLTGSFLGLKYGTKAIRMHGEGGSIVMVSSVLGKVGAANATAFCAAKGGVRLLAKSGACELGPEKIRVNSIHPGLTDTDISKTFSDGVDESQYIKSNIPLNRKATSHEIAKTILFLVSDESVFITGAELTIDGGMSAR